MLRYNTYYTNIISLYFTFLYSLSHAYLSPLIDIFLHLYFYRSRPVWSATPAATAEYSKLRSWTAMAKSTFEKYQSPPAPIDFESAKKNVRDKDLVAQLESFYKSSTPPAEKHEYMATDIELDDAKISYAKDLETFNKDYLPVLKAELEFQVNNRTTMDTTMEQMKMNYPLIHEEIEDELERREWFKDTKYGVKTA
jgi:hypothetical protein